MTVAQTLSAYGAALTSVALPAAVIHHAKRAVLDWHAAAIAGAAEPPARILERALADDLDRGASRLVLGRAATPRAAALINGTAAHTLEVDDIYRHAIYHPGAPTIAAALAQAQAIDASGLAFLRAVVAGYEISTRIGSSLGRAHYRFWHSTGTVGSFGAAAAAATLLQLDPARYTHALCTCATMASGLQQAFRTDSMSKPLHAGHAAQVGLLAAAAAAAGFTGAPDVIDGPAGLGRAMRHPASTPRRLAKQPCAEQPPEGARTAAEGEGIPVSEDPDWHASMATLGREFHITDMTFKNHACCGHAFAPIDGAQALQAQMRISADDIHRIHIGTYAAALDVAGNPDPKTAPEARFSVPFAVATALLYGSVRPAAFSPERLLDARIRALMARIELRIDPQLDAAFPGQRAARVRIVARDARQGQWLQATRKGDPDAPLSDGALNAKFLELTEPVLGAAAAARLRARIWQLEAMPSLRLP
ncbi:MmgE/PrpD family protein [Verminephrobacter eiseniae]|uniref:MmgE/PrpD family protein n=1 Tax=Verminephrobacter eiseniae TaxID=364317 RepID=UPI002237EA7E|nr:MmgE/PrpD family protein [Verminephrobacter eiseniae]MCW5231216.1 MmgE/PrpD family protein [Verminephrobacter eiseniae]MCW5292947.1 MmgE/PrpD family protein [Verminephrobacter eiseniae]MCW8185287.1 MmgE/PrpD family protein [Verminephrobacter eiseniae]MCW8221534.1 MmgE/PrpD family protein [Verminephrobacter eiseniae]MCW8232295.1 MmgE/PrpD family protein [Verminephrobacter eiseniae]